MRRSRALDVGLDVHKASIAVAYAPDDLPEPRTHGSRWTAQDLNWGATS